MLEYSRAHSQLLGTSEADLSRKLGRLEAYYEIYHKLNRASDKEEK